MTRNHMNDPEFSPSEKEIQAEILEESQVDHRRQPKAGSRLVLISVLLAMGVVVAGLALGYRYWQELQSTLNRLDQATSLAGERQTEFRQQLDSMHQALELQQQQLATEQARRAAQESQRKQGQHWLEEERLQLQQQRVEMQEALQAVQRRIEPDSAGWLLTEVEYLIQFANHRLILARDVGVAIQALETAERRLQDTGDPGWVGVRERLTEDINELQGVAQPDLSALSARLTSLEQGVKSLSLVVMERTVQEPGSETQSATPPDERTFKTLLHDGWDGLKSVLVIRHRDKPLRAVLPPEKQYFVYQNLRLQLEAARLALLQGDQRLYETSLQTVEQWLLDFFDSESPNTRAFLGELASLRQINFRPLLPDISDSLIALRERLRPVTAEGAVE